MEAIIMYQNAWNKSISVNLGKKDLIKYAEILQKIDKQWESYDNIQSKIKIANICALYNDIPEQIKKQLRPLIFKTNGDIWQWSRLENKVILLKGRKRLAPQ